MCFCLTDDDDDENGDGDDDDDYDDFFKWNLHDYYPQIHQNSYQTHNELINYPFAQSLGVVLYDYDLVKKSLISPKQIVIS